MAGEGEKEIVAGMTITAELDLSTAAAMQKLGDVRADAAKGVTVPLKVTADQKAVVGDISKQISDASANAVFNVAKLGFKWDGILKANADVQTLEQSLRSMIAISEKGGQSLQATFSSGGKGGRTFKVTAQEDPAVALESVKRHMTEYPQDPMKFSVSGKARDAASQSEAWGAFRNVTKPSPDDERDAIRIRMMDDKQAQKELDAEAKTAAAREKMSQRDSARLRLWEEQKAAKELAYEQEQLAKPKTTWNAEQEKRAGELNIAAGRDVDDTRKKESDAIKRGIMDRERERKQFENAAKQADTFGKAMEYLGQGRMQRAVSTLATGAMTPLLGQTAGGLLGGATGMVLGGALYTLGYQLAGLFEKIPEHILNIIEQNQNIDVARARAASTPLGNLAPSTLTPVIDQSDKRLMTALGVGGMIFNRIDPKGNGGEDFKAALGMTTTEFMGTIKGEKARAEELARLTEEAKNAEFGVLGAGMRGGTTTISRAQAALRLRQDQGAAGTMLGLNGMEDFMVKEKQKDISAGRGGSGFYPGMSKSAMWGEIQRQIKDKLNMPFPEVRQQAVDTITSAFEHVISNDPNVAALRTKAASTQPMKGLGEEWDAAFGSKEHLSLAQLRFIREVQAYRKGDNPTDIPSINLIPNPEAERATQRLGEQYKTAKEYKLIDWMARRAGLTDEEAKALLPDGLSGLDANLMLGIPKPPSPYKNDPFLQMKSSTQSLEGLRKKMQDMNGIQYNMTAGMTQGGIAKSMASIPAAADDATQATARNTQLTNQKLDILIGKMTGPARLGLGAFLAH